MLFPLHCEVQLLAGWDAGATRKNLGPPTNHCHLWWDGDSLLSSLGPVQNMVWHGGRLPAGMQPLRCAQPAMPATFLPQQCLGHRELPADALTLVSCAS